MSEEARVNALVLLAWSANGTHLPYSAITDIARKSLCSPRAVCKIWMQLLDGKKPLDIVKSKKNGNANANCYDPDDIVKKFVCFLLIIARPYMILVILWESLLRPFGLL